MKTVIFTITTLLATFGSNAALAFGPHGCEHFERQCVCLDAWSAPGTKIYFNSCKVQKSGASADFAAWQWEQNGKCVKGSVACYDLPEEETQE